MSISYNYGTNGVGHLEPDQSAWDWCHGCPPGVCQVHSCPLPEGSTRGSRPFRVTEHHQLLAAMTFDVLVLACTMVSGFLVSIAHCTLQSITWLQYWKCGVLLEFWWCMAHENPPFQYCNHVIACRVQCAIGTRNPKPLCQNTMCMCVTWFVWKWKQACWVSFGWLCMHTNKQGMLKDLYAWKRALMRCTCVWRARLSRRMDICNIDTCLSFLSG